MDQTVQNRLRLRIAEVFPAALPAELRKPPTSGTQDPEFVAIRNYFSGRVWDSVTIDSMMDSGISDLHVVTAGMSDAAFHYYVPGLLIAGLGETWRSRAILTAC